MDSFVVLELKSSQNGCRVTLKSTEVSKTVQNDVLSQCFMVVISILYPEEAFLKCNFVQCRPSFHRKLPKIMAKNLTFEIKQRKASID